MRYVIKINKKGWPPELSVEDGKHFKKYDVIEDEIPDEWKDWYKAHAEKKQLHCAESARDLPMGFDDETIPSWAKLEPR